MKKKTNKTILNFILDKSGSMSVVQDATISGFNEYISSLKKDKKSSFEFTLTLFDTLIQKPHIAVSLAEVKDLDRNSYQPDGMTALYDAVCQTIRSIKTKKGQKVITIIMTDGQENSSREYDQKKMKSLIADREKEGDWTFVYLGANQDSYANAQNFGIPMGNVANFNTTVRGMSSAMRVLATNTTMTSASNNASTIKFFSQADQTKLENEK